MGEQLIYNTDMSSDQIDAILGGVLPPHGPLAGCPSLKLCLVGRMQMAMMSLSF